MTTVTRTSLHPSQPPHATGTATATARKGIAMNSPRAICSLRDWMAPPSVALVGSSSTEVLSAAAAAPGGVMRVFLKLGDVHTKCVTYAEVGLGCVGTRLPAVLHVRSVGCPRTIP